MPTAAAAAAAAISRSRCETAKEAAQKECKSCGGGSTSGYSKFQSYPLAIGQAVIALFYNQEGSSGTDKNETGEYWLSARVSDALSRRIIAKRSRAEEIHLSYRFLGECFILSAYRRLRGRIKSVKRICSKSERKSRDIRSEICISEYSARGLLEARRYGSRPSAACIVDATSASNVTRARDINRRDNCGRYVGSLEGEKARNPISDANPIGVGLFGPFSDRLRERVGRARRSTRTATFRNVIRLSIGLA